MNTHRFHRPSAALAVFSMLVAMIQVPASAAPPRAAITIKDAWVIEGDAGSKVLSFEVRAKGRDAAKASVSWATADDTAIAGSDYKAANGTLHFTSGLRQIIHITVMGDAADETNETLQVNLSAAAHAKISDPQGLGTIQDDDEAQALPALSIADDVVGEGNEGSATEASFEITLSKPSASAVTVNYLTADATATAGSDYAAVPPSTLTFAPGDVTEFAAVEVKGDNIDEAANETLAVNLSGPNGAAITDGSATGTIVDDESAPAISIGDVTVTEGDTGVTTATFEVTSSHASDSDVTLQYATVAGSANTALDFHDALPTDLLFPGHGPLSQTVSIEVVGDLIDESDEAFTVALSNIQGGLPADIEGKSVIVDNDTTGVRLDGGTSVEGDGPVAFTLRLTKPSSQNVTVHYTTADGTAKAASDYVAAAAGANFAPGATSQVISVGVIDDGVAERPQSFTLGITQTINAELADGEAVGTILDDDRKPSYTKLSKRIRGGRIHVAGRLSPAHKGRKMTVTLKKRTQGRWVKVRTKRPLLSAGIDVNRDGVLDSKFATRFMNPRNATRCRLVARFTGDLHHFPSQARRTFNC